MTPRAALEQAGLAEEIAAKAHKGQKRSNGEPYFNHVERVALALADPMERAIAYLHDVVEDTEWCAHSLTLMHVHPDIVAAVNLLTRRETDDYADYITRLVESANLAVLRVKRADLKDNMRDLPIDDRRLVRYARASQRIEEVIEWLEFNNTLGKADCQG